VCGTLPPKIADNIPVNLCDNPALTTCLTNLLDTQPGDLDLGALQPILDNVLENCTQGALDTICGTDRLPAQVQQLCGILRGLPLELPKVPLPVPSLSQLQKCLTSGKPLGAACDDLDPLTIARRCAATTSRTKPRGFYSETCKRYRELNLGITRGGDLGRLPIIGGGSGSTGGTGGGGGETGGGGLLGGGGLTGLGRPGFGGTSDSGRASNASARTSAESDLGALLVWGMMPR
jgi:hypothetical protein